jgi:hypothetical protein
MIAWKSSYSQSVLRLWGTRNGCLYELCGYGYAVIVLLKVGVADLEAVNCKVTRVHVGDIHDLFIIYPNSILG